MKKEPKMKTTICFDKELREKAENKFSTYGVNLQTGITILLKLLVDEKIKVFQER